MKTCLLSLAFLILFVVPTQAADYRVELLDEPAAAEELSAEVVATLAPTGARVIRGTKTKFCDIWLCKEWATLKDFEPTGELLYPFTPGQLIGVVRYSRRGSDFRDQDIDKGVYTIRYAQQPVDGSHVGTSLTRDFVLLLLAESDSSPDVIDYESLTERSAEAAGSSHPALLSMQRISKDAKFPSMRHDEEHDLWIIALQGQGDGGKPLAIEFVVYGVAAE